MSLRPDDRKGRSRSKSRDRGRERSRSHARAPSPGPQYYASAAEHGGVTPQPQYEVRQPGQGYATPASEPITMGNYADLPPEQRPGFMHQAQAAVNYQYASGGGPAPPAPGVSYTAPLQHGQSSQYNYTSTPSHQAGLTRNPSTGGGGGVFQYAQAPDKITFTAKPIVPQTSQPAVRHTPYATSPPAGAAPQQQPYYPSMPHAQAQAHPQAHQHPQAHPHPPPPPPPPPPQTAPAHSFPPPPMGRHSPQPAHDRAPSQSTHYDGHRVVSMVPQGGGRMNAPPSPGLRPHSLSVSGGHPDGLSNRMNRLSVSGNRPDLHTLVPGGMPGSFPGGGGLPPPSPMLEAYHGVYQSISPMPQAMMLNNEDIDHLPMLDNLSPRASGISVHGRHRSHSTSRRTPSPHRKPRHKDKLAMEAYGGGRDRERERERERDQGREKERRVKIYDAEEDARALVDAMAGKPPDVDTIVDILPALSHDQMLELRREYKKHCKVQGHGINIAKHIKLKTSGNFGKIAYVTALGRYESEGYWANFWYQSGNARRELLIEALMGRQNFEIREIKDAFKDKRYGDSLTRCMDKELKADKFRKAVLMALEAERQEESDVWEVEYRNRDADTLYRALKAKEGGESAMLGIVVMRSDAHLREVLRTYESKYMGSFARDALRKSNNLVGEVIAHILNGVINRPARDAMLLHHALMDLIEPSLDGPRSSSGRLSSKEATSSKHDRQQRFELVVSRLVRLHWDRLHFIRVKTEYEERYGRVVEEDVEEATKGDFREFCIALCQMGR